MAETKKALPFQDLPHAEQDKAVDTEKDLKVLARYDATLKALGYAENNRLRMRIAIRRSELGQGKLSKEFRARASAIKLGDRLPPEKE